MSKRHRLFISLPLCFKDGHKSVFLPITSSFHISRLRPLCRFGGGRARVLNVLRPGVVPETLIQCLDAFKTVRESLTSYHRRLRESKQPCYCGAMYISLIGSV